MSWKEYVFDYFEYLLYDGEKYEFQRPPNGKLYTFLQLAIRF